MSNNVIKELIGKVFTTVREDGEDLTFLDEEGNGYKFYHDQGCCESVYIEDVAGNLSDLENTPILLAEEVSNFEEPEVEQYAESYTWTFYKFATIKGYVTVRWLGISNGYYSESVNFKEIRKES